MAPSSIAWPPVIPWRASRSRAVASPQVGISEHHREEHADWARGGSVRDRTQLGIEEVALTKREAKATQAEARIALP